MYLWNGILRSCQLSVDLRQPICSSAHSLQTLRALVRLIAAFLNVAYISGADYVPAVSAQRLRHMASNWLSSLWLYPCSGWTSPTCSHTNKPRRNYYLSSTSLLRFPLILKLSPRNPFFCINMPTQHSHKLLPSHLHPTISPGRNILPSPDHIFLTLALLTTTLSDLPFLIPHYS